LQHIRVETAQRLCENLTTEILFSAVSSTSLSQLIHQLPESAHVAGEVVLQVVIDEEGDVMAAQVLSGHSLLRAPCVKAARETRFESTLWKTNW
jgi:hypothetical protein